MTVFNLLKNHMIKTLKYHFLFGLVLKIVFILYLFILGVATFAKFAQICAVKAKRRMSIIANPSYSFPQQFLKANSYIVASR